MPRVKRGARHVKRRKYLMSRVKGFEGGRKNLIRLAATAESKAGAHAHRDRRIKKRIARKTFQVRINAGARTLGTSYSKLMGGLKKKGIILDRKVLSQMAASFPEVFKKLADSVK